MERILFTNLIIKRHFERFYFAVLPRLVTDVLLSVTVYNFKKATYATNDLSLILVLDNAPPP